MLRRVYLGQNFELRKKRNWILKKVKCQYLVAVISCKKQYEIQKLINVTEIIFISHENFVNNKIIPKEEMYSLTEK
jgi:hypothetical protein